MKFFQGFYFVLLIIFLLLSCGEEAVPGTTFTKVSKSKTGIDFRNMIRETEILTYFNTNTFTMEED